MTRKKRDIVIHAGSPMLDQVIQLKVVDLAQQFITLRKLVERIEEINKDKAVDDLIAEFKRGNCS